MKWTPWILLLCGAACSGASVKSLPDEILPPIGGDAGKAKAPVEPEADAASQVQKTARADEVTYDEVLAIIGSEVITESEIREPLELEYRAARARKGKGAKLTPAERSAIRTRLIQDQVSSYLLADHVNMLGHDPERIEQVVESVLQQRVAKMRREAGGDIQLLDRLKRRGLYYPQFLEQERARIRREIALSEKLRNTRASSPLLATPADLLRYYNEHESEFTEKARADVVTLRFNRRAGAAAPADRAKAARQALAGGTELAAVAKRHEATVDTLDGIEPDGDALKLVRTFAFEADPGTVSKPVTVSDEVWLLKLAKRTEGRRRPFLDRRVQDEIRQKLLRARRQEVLMRIDTEERRRVRIWPPDLLRR